MSMAMVALTQAMMMVRVMFDVYNDVGRTHTHGVAVVLWSFRNYTLGIWNMAYF